MSIVATYSVHDEQPRVLRRVDGNRRWCVTIWATDGEVKLEQTIKNRQPARLMSILCAATEAIDEILSELPAYTDAGFQVVLLR